MRLIRTSLPVVFLLFALTACGGGEDTTESKTEDALLQYAQCMRDNGVQIADPKTDDPGSLYDGVDKSSAAFVSANGKCGHFLDGVVQERQNQNATDQAEEEQKLLALAQCLRDNGVNVPDPVPGQEGGAFGDSLDRTDPKVAQALQTCQQAS